MEELGKRIFDTDKRIRLGIWGLGRGSNFIRSCKALNIDVVAGCDYNPFMRTKFKELCPDAFVTDDEDAFLAQDIDAVLVATWFGAHAAHSIKALEAGKHVMCEVTSFFTPAEGVRLVEAVEKSGKVYNLLENYPFTKDNLYVRSLWRDGFFGDLHYAEYDYLHDCRSLAYTYIDQQPVQPGWTAHNWRSWHPHHYYCTHSLGPVMQITGRRPVEVTSLPCGFSVPGNMVPDGGFGRCSLKGIAPSLIRMDNGALVRNLIGGLSGDSHLRRLWGEYASVDLTEGIKIRVGASGHGRLYKVEAKWDALGELAEKTGHGGGDFWELYYFARQILTGEKAPWDVYAASDVTVTGIMALKSCLSGHAEEVPDFRLKEVRDRYRDDHFKPEHIDPEKIFPEGHDKAKTARFTSVMARMNNFNEQIGTTLVRDVFDGMKLERDFAGPAEREKLIQDVRHLVRDLPALARNYREARSLLEAYPDCPAGRALAATLKMGYEEKVVDTERTLEELRDWLLRPYPRNPVFRNPVSADDRSAPFAVYSKEWQSYFGLSTKGDRLYLHGATRLQDLFIWGTAAPVFEAGKGQVVESGLRSLAIHFGSDRRWYIYGRGRAEGKGTVLFVLPSKTDNPFDGLEPPVVLGTFPEDSAPVVLSLADGGLSVADLEGEGVVLREMASPVSCGGRSAVLPFPGPVHGAFGYGDRTFLAYRTADGAVGLAELEGDDLFEPGSWRLSSIALFDAGAGIAAPGDLSFLTSPDESEGWALYSAPVPGGEGGRGPRLHLQPLAFDRDGTPLPVACRGTGGLYAPSGEI